MSDITGGLLGQDQITTLLTIVRTRSFSAAAAELGVSQPAVSKQVKRLEAWAGRKLFRRGSSRIELTPEGEALVIYCEAMTTLNDDLRQQFRRATGVVKLRIGMSEDFCRTALPSVLAMFIRDNPSIEMFISSGRRQTMTAELGARMLDVLVIRKSENLEGALPLSREKLVWVGRENLPFPVADPIPLVLPPAPSGTRDAILRTLRQHRRTWRIPFETVHLAGIEAAVQAGIGICGFPQSMRRLGVCELGGESGLPPLPDAEYVMLMPEPVVSDLVPLFCEVLRRCASLGFRRGQGPA